MDPRQATNELQALSQAIAPFSAELSSRLLTASLSLREAPARTAADDEDSAYQQGRAIMDQEMESFAKGRGWWMPPQNLGVNETLLGGINLWRFSLLPMFPKKKGYSEKLNGIVIHPIWQPLSKETYGELDPDFAKKLVALARKSPTIQEDVRQELAWLEREFKIRIPEAIKASLIKDAIKTAKRRWGTDRLRVKDRLVPLDGSKPRDLGSFDLF